MNHEKYKVIKSQEEFFGEWEEETLIQVPPGMKEKIYKRYFIKCAVFQRDNFICINKECKTPASKITLHHIKFQKNNGKDSLKNCATICQACHNAYHRGKNTLTIGEMTYAIHPIEKEINWKNVMSKTKQMRKGVKDQYGMVISWELIEILMRFLEIDYSIIFDDEDD